MMNRVIASIVTLAMSCGIVFLSASVTHADVDDFSISTYDVELKLGRDDAGQSTLRTTETIVAKFPDLDQNRGIERYIPKSYDNHSTQPKVISVTDTTGQSLTYTTYDSGEYMVVRIGDKNKYVRGTQAYKVVYTQSNVTKTFDDETLEFYWDSNGTEWKVPIESLTTKIVIDEPLSAQLTDRQKCYTGGYRSETECEITRQNNTFLTSSGPLARGESVSVAIGFAPETFTAYQRPWYEYALIAVSVIQGVGLIAAVGLVLFYGVRYYQWSGRTKEIGTIVPEYLPPDGASLQTAASLVGSLHSFSGQLIDFAVRHYIKIHETKAKGIFSNAEYEFEIIRSTDDLLEEEKEFLRDVFLSTDVGTTTTTESLRKDRKLASRLQDNPGKLRKLMLDRYGLRHKDEAKSAWFKKQAKLLLTVGILLWPLLVLAAIVFALSYTLKPLTDKGVELHRYLKGLKMYIGVAEVERLRMLQSPEGAAKARVSSGDPKQLVKLYEKVLPYAIIFGQEKQWNKQLGQYYETSNQQPDWYTGAAIAGFSAANFSSAVSNLTTSIDASGSSYSSSGGSGGGGYSGGGGGGGGGGGW